MITKWFDKWFYRQAKKAWENKDKYATEYESSIREKALQGIAINSQIVGHRDMVAGRLDTQPDLNFKMYSAENGYVMEVRHTDRKTERQSVNLHVITENQDLGEAIGHILTLESLKIK